MLTLLARMPPVPLIEACAAPKTLNTPYKTPQTLDTKCKTPKTLANDYKTLNTLNTKYQTPNTHHQTLDPHTLLTQHCTLNTKRSMLSAKHDTPNTQHPTLNAQAGFRERNRRSSRRRGASLSPRPPSPPSNKYHLTLFSSAGAPLF